MFCSFQESSVVISVFVVLFGYSPDLRVQISPVIFWILWYDFVEASCGGIHRLLGQFRVLNNRLQNRRRQSLDIFRQLAEPFGDVYARLLRKFDLPRRGSFFTPVLLEPVEQRPEIGSQLRHLWITPIEGLSVCCNYVVGKFVYEIDRQPTRQVREKMTRRAIGKILWRIYKLLP